jgi:hypothetical protein
MKTMSHTLTQGRQSPWVHNRYISTTLYDLMDALYDQIAPGEEALVMAAVMELMQAGRLVCGGAVTPEEV